MLGDFWDGDSPVLQKQFCHTWLTQCGQAMQSPLAPREAQDSEGGWEIPGTSDRFHFKMNSKKKQLPSFFVSAALQLQ